MKFKQLSLCLFLVLFQWACDPQALVSQQMSGAAPSAQSSATDEATDLIDTNLDSSDVLASLPVTPPKLEDECLPEQNGDMQIIMHSGDGEFQDIDFPDKDEGRILLTDLKHLNPQDLLNDGLEGEVLVCERKPGTGSFEWKLVDPKNFPDLKLGFGFQTEDEEGEDDFEISPSGHFEIPADWFSTQDQEFTLELKSNQGPRFQQKFKKFKNKFLKK